MTAWALVLGGGAMVLAAWAGIVWQTYLAVRAIVRRFGR